MVGDYVELVTKIGGKNTMPVYDNSKLQTFKNCPESYRLKYIECLDKIEEAIESHDRGFGSAIHAGLECLYKGEGAEKAKKVFKDEYTIQLDMEDLAKTQDNGLIILDAYAKHYETQDKNWTIKSVEVVDTFKLDDKTEFQVKIDLVIEQQGCIYFVDHKTTKKAFNYSYWNQFEPNSQITAYTAYCQSKYGECSGGIINGIQLGYRQRAYKGEPAGFHYSFQRQLFNRNKEQVNAWKEDTLRWINTLDTSTAKLPTVASLRSAPIVWPKNEGQCMYCQYKPICISCYDEQIVTQLFKRVNPNEYLNEKEVVV